MTTRIASGPMPTTRVRAGLYALKPWYARRLTPARTWLVTRQVHPDLVSAAGVAAGAAGGLALAGLHPGPLAGLVVAVALAARLGCANLDGGLARERGISSVRGAVVNELGDRTAELAALAGVVALAPSWLVLLAALCASAPSWIALAGAAAGRPRIQGGPVGKTERVALLVAIAFTGWASALVAVLAAGSLLTAGVRLARLVRTER